MRNIHIYQGEDSKSRNNSQHDPVLIRVAVGVWDVPDSGIQKESDYLRGFLELNRTA